ncbi:MAG TPA: FMN-binding protein [Gammaproteobacteria bacterium]|nr:FMN-binding protein [Gammaproteobacteria bacterium]
MSRYFPTISLLLLSCLFALEGFAGERIYQAPQAFVAEVFADTPPAPRSLWITGERRKQVEAILGRRPRGLRVRYWQHADTTRNLHRSAWILEAIGKEKPITVGVVVRDGRIEQIKVLVFRESRGQEVQRPAFTAQFRDAQLDENRQLDRSIDGITGATLSVRALKKLARLALFYAGQVAQQERSGHDAP